MKVFRLSKGKPSFFKGDNWAIFSDRFERQREGAKKFKKKFKKHLHKFLGFCILILAMQV